MTFDIDPEANKEIEHAKRVLDDIKLQQYKLKDVERREWRKFYDLVREMKHNDATEQDSCSHIGDTLGWIVYQNDKLIAVYDVREVYIYLKIKHFKVSRLRALLGIPLHLDKTTVEKLVHLENTEDKYGKDAVGITEIRYEFIADYVQLYKEMSAYYLEKLKQRAYTAQAELEFRKLTQFA